MFSSTVRYRYFYHCKLCTFAAPYGQKGNFTAHMLTQYVSDSCFVRFMLIWPFKWDRRRQVTLS